MKFVIRDDDLNYFSTPEEVLRWYADIFADGIPVGFSAIPFIQPSGDAYPNPMPATADEYPIGDNAALVALLQKQPLAEILQHGTTHTTTDGVFEYRGHVPLDEAKRGREELERAFGRSITVFVPPHDWIGASGIRAIEYAKMDVIRGRGAGLRNWLWRWQYAAIFLRMLAFKLAHALRGRSVPAYPYVLNFGKHKEVCSYRLEDDDLFDGLAYAHRKNGIFVVVAHLHFSTEEGKQRLRAVIREGKRLGAEFVFPSALFKK